MPGHCESSSSFTRKNAAFDVFAAEAQILIEASGLLAVQVDVKELSRLERLRHAVREIEPGHRVVRDLGIEADHVRMIERVDEREHVADRRQEDVAARLVRLGLERELEVVALRSDVLAEEVERVAEPLERLLRILGGVRLDAFASAPEHVRLRAELHAEVDGAHRLLERVRAHARVVARERAVAEDRIAEQVRRRHRHVHAACSRAPP